MRDAAALLPSTAVRRMIRTAPVGNLSGLYGAIVTALAASGDAAIYRRAAGVPTVRWSSLASASTEYGFCSNGKPWLPSSARTVL